MPPASARAVAARQLAEHAGRFPDLLPAAVDTAHLDERDAALAHAIVDAAVRRWLTLAYLMDRVLRQPFDALEPAVRGILLSGAAQLLLMDRIPAHAAINESVEIAKGVLGRGAGGLVNAVLRKVSQMRAEGAHGSAAWEGRRDRLPMPDGESVGLTGELLPADELERLAVATSHGSWLIERWSVAHGETARALALHSLVMPPTILNTAHAKASLPEVLQPHSQPGHHVFTGTRAELIELLQARDDVWVQDPASALAVAGAAHLRPRLVVDACAGQGTKTRQLAAVFPDAAMVATDVDAARYRTLVESHPAGGRVEVVRPDHLLERFAGKADLVLLDVPCSNSGVLARRPEAKYRAGMAQLKRLTEIQRQIVADSIPLLTRAPRGRILYSTCSIEREENEGVVAWAVQWHRLRVEHQRLALPAGAPGQEGTAYHDGSFSALLG